MAEKKRQNTTEEKWNYKKQRIYNNVLEYKIEWKIGENKMIDNNITNDLSNCLDESPL